MALQNLTMTLQTHLGWPLSLKTPNIGNTGLVLFPSTERASIGSGPARVCAGLSNYLKILTHKCIERFRG